MKLAGKLLQFGRAFSNWNGSWLAQLSARRGLHRVRWHTLILIVCCITLSSCNRSCTGTGPDGTSAPTPSPVSDLDNQVPGRDLREDPPVVESVIARPLQSPTAEGNALVLVKFGPEEKFPPQLSIDTEEGQLTLHDDGKNGDERAGDGTFSAIAKLDLEALKRSNIDRLTRAQDAPIPTFVNRAKVKEDRAPSLLERFRLADLDLTPFGLPASVDISRSLMITDLTVVQDPTRTRTACTGAGSSSMGKWSFGYLMQEMANTPLTGISTSDFTRKWLDTWMSPQTINGWTVAQRTAIQTQVINPWIAASGGPGNPLDMSKAPFRLLAIVNRIDLRQNLVYGSGNAGEGRFVFGVMGPGCVPLRFVIIFEYGISQRGCKGLKSWGQQWKDLDLHPIGSAAYNAALEAITEQFVKANSAPSKPNGSALNQLRTNENSLNPLWELREFQVAPKGDPFGGLLKPVTVKQTPDISHNQTVLLVKYVDGNATLIKAQKHVVPLEFPAGSHFLGGSALTPGGMFWDDPPAPPAIADREARHMFSLQTCNGCHMRETNTTFLHVGTAPFGGGSPPLSTFLTNLPGEAPVVDPADGAPSRDFDDLERRAADLDALLTSPCIGIIKIPRLRMVH